MNKETVDFKSTEYIGKMGVAMSRGDLESARKYTRTLLTLYRVRAREAVAELVQDSFHPHTQFFISLHPRP